MRDASLRVRVAAVVAASCVVCVVVMGLLGTAITRERIEHVAGGASKDVAALLALELQAQGVTVERLAADPELQARVSADLGEHLQRLNRLQSGWTTATILQPAGDRWRVLARADISDSDRSLRGPGETLPVLGGDGYKPLSLQDPVSGWFRTDRNRWFGSSVPLRTMDEGAAATGVLTMTMHLDDVHDFWTEVQRMVLGALAVSTVVGLAVGWWSAGMLLRPIETLRAFAASLGRREYSARIAEHGAPEMRRLLRDMNQLADDLARRDERLLHCMARMAETRDPTETGPHVKRVSAVSLEILDGWQARHPQEPRKAAIQREFLESAAILHDVGKVGVSDLVLNKPGKLDEAEYATMKHHSVLAAALLSDDDDYERHARDVALRHHERWDGKGYPGAADIASAKGDILALRDLPLPAAGLLGEQIPLFARIVSIADVFDALSSRRAYKEPWPEAKVVQTIRDESGRAFDPELVEIFLERIDRIRAAWARHPDRPHG